jgi:hypothetical protein
MSILLFDNFQAVAPPGPPEIRAFAKESPGELPLGSVYFNDETGKNPLPPGVLVSIYLAGMAQTAGNVVYSGYTQLGGVISFNPKAAVQYVASFYGALGPSTTQAFFGSAQGGVSTVVSVQKYRSPFLSQAGYVDAQIQHWPPGRFGDAALEPGGVAYALAYTFAYLLAYFDIETQQTLSSERIQTCVAAQIDSWAFDFFGQYVLRYPGESDAIYLTRILSLFGPRCTIPAIQQVVQQFYVATALQTQQELQQNLAADIVGAADISGGADVYIAPTPIDELIPDVTVWDAQSNPALAQTYDICPPQFVVQIAFDNSQGWFLDYSFLDFDTFLTNGGALVVSDAAPDPRLGALVSLVKACGTKPMYGVTS